MLSIRLRVSGVPIFVSVLGLFVWSIIRSYEGLHGVYKRFIGGFKLFHRLVFRAFSRDPGLTVYDLGI